MRVRENIRKRDQSEEQRGGLSRGGTRPAPRRWGGAGSGWAEMGCQGSLPCFPCPVTKASNTTERVCLSSQEMLAQRASYHEGQKAAVRTCHSPSRTAPGTTTRTQSLVHPVPPHPSICYHPLPSTCPRAGSFTRITGMNHRRQPEELILLLFSFDR